MKQLIALSILSLSMVLISCDPERSEDVNQDRINTDYSIQYKDQKGETEAAAAFWFGSTPLRLTAPAEVTADDRLLKKREFLGIVDYTRTFDSQKATVTFSYTDVDGRTFVNAATLPASIQVDGSVTSFSRSQDQLFTWIGDPVGSDEHVDMQFRSEDGESLHYVSKSNTGSSSVLLSANDLGADFIGNVKINFIRYKKSDLQEGPRNGKITSSFYSKTVIMEVTD